MGSGGGFRLLQSGPYWNLQGNGRTAGSWPARLGFFGGCYSDLEKALIPNTYADIYIDASAKKQSFKQ